MERNQVQGYVASLEQIIRNSYLFLKETVDGFQELCHMVTPDRNVPQAIITDIRSTHKQIQDQLAKISGVQQLLMGKYRQYYRRDLMLDKEITEFGFLAKNCYLKFEYALREIEAKKRLREQGRLIQAHGRGAPFPWFRARENQIILLKNLQGLGNLGYEMLSQSAIEERRRIIQDKPCSLSLFVFSGEVSFIDNLQSRIRLRKYDITERYGQDEIRGALAHLRDVSVPEVERVVRRFIEGPEFSKTKCLLFSIQSPKDLGKEIVGSTEKILQEMTGGEVKIFKF